jgi:hypothetical protein
MFISFENEKLIKDTIEILKLNSDNHFYDSRKQTIDKYRKNEMPFELLTYLFPFIASELERQNLKEPKELEKYFPSFSNSDTSH